MASIGEILRETRKKKGVSEEAAAKVLKIKVERLRDLETDRYDQFAAQVYARSFLRHYAEYLGLDAVALLQQFMEQHPPELPRPIFEITESQRGESPVQRHTPDAPPMLLTATGKTVVAAAFLIFFLVASTMWWIAHRPLPVVPRPAAAGFTPPPAPEPADPMLDPAEATPPPAPVLPTTITPPVLSTNRAPADVLHTP